MAKWTFIHLFRVSLRLEDDTWQKLPEPTAGALAKSHLCLGLVPL